MTEKLRTKAKRSYYFGAILFILGCILYFTGENLKLPPYIMIACGAALMAGTGVTQLNKRKKETHKTD